MHVTAAVFISILGGCLQLALCQQCPYGWYGYSPTSKCYRFVATSKLPWQDARDFCKLHGGDLLKIDSIQERTWVYGQIHYIAAHNKQVSPSNWWTGLNNNEYITSWEWADGSPAKYINWKPNEPNNAQGDERCGEIMYGNSFNDETCSDNDNFICYRDRGIPLTCDADRGWQTLNGQCYKVYTARKSWNAAQRQCDHDGGALATIPSATVEQTLHDFAASAKQPLWIGVHSLQTGSTTNSWINVNGTQLTTQTFWRAGKVPRVDRRQLNNTCVDISNTGTSQQAWNPSVCSTSRAFVCQKPVGVCFPGWIGHRGYCYQFDALYRLSFNAAARFCQNQGSELMRIANGADQMFLVSYLDEMKDSGDNSIWIGLSDNNQDTGPYKWRNGQTVASSLKNNWARPNHVPTNTKGRTDCVYINTNDGAGKWRTTTNCASTRAFVCRIPMGRSIKGQPSTPRPHFGCPSGWMLHKDTCFRIFDRSLNSQTARQKCQMTNGADLAKITNSDMQGFVNGKIKNKGVAYYIGVNDKTTNGVFVWNDETTATSYTNWARGQPNDPSKTKNCVVLRQSQWSVVPCSQPHMYICSLLANSAFIPISTTPQVDWTIKCGPGWESNPITDSCYQFVDRPLSWPDARLQCKVAGGDLVAIETLTEQNYLAGRLRSMSSIVVWTGANDRKTEDGWNWVSGDPFSFLNWAPGQPGGSKGQGTDCVAMLTSTALWDDITCNTRNGFVCEKKGNVPTTKPPTVKPTTIPAGKKLGCNTGWLPFGSNCYRIVPKQINWASASQQCSYAGSRLASILSADEQNFIVGNLKKSSNPIYGYWIGLNDQKVDTSFQWSDGSTITYTNWNVHEPNNWMNRNEDCVEIKLKNGKWNDDVCSTLKQGFICKKPKSIVSATQSPYQVNCRTFDRGYGPYCYSLFSGTPSTWAAANAKCKSQLNGTLATVNDRFQQAFLSSWLTTHWGFYWIGIKDNAKSGTWADGTQIQYTNWGRNHTGNEATATCIVMKSRPIPVGFWQNAQCGQKNNFICQYHRTGYTLPPTTSPYPNVPCPTGWTANAGFCYKVYSPNPGLYWTQASAYCQSLGGNLASFHANNNDSFLYPLVQNLKSANFYIGLNDRDTENGHKWTDGSPVDYTNWNPGEPNDFGGFEDCVVYTKYSKRWNDVGCYSVNPFVCMIPRGAQVQTTPVPPTAITSSQCGANWIFYNGSCYLPSPVSGSNSSLSWYDAETFCEGNQATLASFHGFDEIEAVLGALTQRKNYNVWIGLNILGGDSYRWVDGTPLDYDNWNPNEPNDFGGVERCAEMTKYNGKWNDDQCSMTRAFICRRPLHGLATPATPAPYPSGGCQNGFTQAPGGRNKCFYLGGGNSQPGMKKTFKDAIAFCRNFGKGYDIASLEDLYEQEFVITMTYGTRSSLWIGLQDTRGNNKFFWQDSAPVVYTNWDHYEPTSARRGATDANKQNCVVMRMYKGHEGRWADLDCTMPRGFVCQSRQIPTVPILKPQSSCNVQGYVPYSLSCYKISKTAKSWNDASTDCQNDGGQLTSVLDVFEKSFVLVQANKITPYWIGLSDQYTPGLYGWSDGNPVRYSNWGWGEPSYGQLDSNKTNHGCVFVNRNGRWNDSDCSITLKYVCKITKVTPPPTQPPIYGNCSNPKAKSNAGYCYYVSVNQGRSWPEANYECQKMGMNLTSVQSEGEMQYLVVLTSQAKVTNPKYKPNIWLGMSKGPQGAYRWTDGSAVSYLNWAKGEPSTLGKAGNQEECIEYDRVTGGWNDVGCRANRGYVCKAPDPTVTVTLPTQLPFSFQPINPGTGQPPPNARTFSRFNAVTDSLGVRTGRGGSKLPPLTYPVGGGPTGNPIGITAAPQKITASTIGLSGGGIAGVVIGSLVILAVAVALLFYLKKTGKIQPPSFDNDGPSVGFDNALYDRGADSVKIDSDA